MRCPFCKNPDTQVKDSRVAQEANVVRRRRICPHCTARFTTLERVHMKMWVEKRGGVKEPFERHKLVKSLTIALRKRPVNRDAIEEIINQITGKLESLRAHEVTSMEIGKMVMEKLAELDMVAYLRFASVYMNFDNVQDFKDLINKLL